MSDVVSSLYVSLPTPSGILALLFPLCPWHDDPFFSLGSFSPLLLMFRPCKDPYPQRNRSAARPSPLFLLPTTGQSHVSLKALLAAAQLSLAVAMLMVPRLPSPPAAAARHLVISFPVSHALTPFQAGRAPVNLFKPHVSPLGDYRHSPRSTLEEITSPPLHGVSPYLRLSSIRCHVPTSAGTATRSTCLYFDATHAYSLHHRGAMSTPPLQLFPALVGDQVHVFP